MQRDAATRLSRSDADEHRRYYRAPQAQQAMPRLGRMFLVLSLLYCPAWAQTTSSALTIQVGPAGTPPLSLVNHGDLWRYRKGTSAPPAGWQTNAEATLDGSWLSGPGGFGYGDAAIIGEATPLNDM